jgi:hypothetical protein
MSGPETQPGTVDPEYFTLGKLDVEAAQED